MNFPNPSSDPIARDLGNHAADKINAAMKHMTEMSANDRQAMLAGMIAFGAMTGFVTGLMQKAVPALEGQDPLDIAAILVALTKHAAEERKASIQVERP